MAEQTSKADRVKLNRELAQMLKGGVIMDVTTPEQARIRRRGGRLRRHGTRTHPGRHPCRRRRLAHE